MKKTSYKDAGVDIAKGERAVSDVKEMIRSTHNASVLGNVGGFGGLFELDTAELKRPVLVSSTDGVGTKLRVAVLANRHDTVGEDLVNHCVNDIAVMGARPLFFLDYFATASLDENVFSAIISGFARGCRNNGCALIGGETAEMPGIYHGKDYDVCGTIVGVVDKAKIVDGSDIRAGDVLIGVASNGLHTNGYSLARKVLLENYKINQHVNELGHSLADELLRVHVSYLDVIERAIGLGANGFAHITGGGIEGNSKRILPDGLRLSIDWKSWERPAVFNLIQHKGQVDEEDMRRTFNLGVGLVIAARQKDAGQIVSGAEKMGHKAFVIGSVEKGA